MIGKKNFVVFPHKSDNLLKYCMCYRMSTSSNVAATIRKLFEQCNKNIELSNGQKRQMSTTVVSSQKKAKGKGNTFQRPFWLGYHALNAVACENNKSLELTHSISEFIKKGMSHDD